MRRLPLVVAAVSTALTLGACAGSVGGNSNEKGSGGGFEYGASQSEIDAALEDLDPVKLTYQTAAASPDSIQGKDKVWAEAIEKLSGGKIEVEIIYGQAIAGFDEIHDALADGRVDLAYTLPGYDPSRFPVFNDVGLMLSELPSSPMTGELVANAVGAELSWGTEPLLEEFEGQGLVPLLPVLASAAFYTQCNSPGTDLADWDGRQVRGGAAAHQDVLEDLGAKSVSLSFTEIFEALQRRTVDCGLTSLNTAVDYGIIDAANHLGHTTETSIPRSPGAILAGATFTSLPLAYQQVIFDSLVAAFTGSLDIVVDGNHAAVERVLKNGGSIEEWGPDAQAQLAKTNARLIEDIEERGVLPKDTAAQVNSMGEKWSAKAEELGFTDGGGVEDIGEWYDVETEFTPFSQVVVDDVLTKHRPN